MVSLRKTEPALFAWYLADEPEGYGDTPDVLRQAYAIIKSIDPDHPVVVLTNAPGMLQRYDGCADIIVADPYPIPRHPLAMVAEWTDVCVAAARVHGQAPWMTPQGFGWSDIGDSEAPSPTREELTNMLYTCLIHGAKGILWWSYSTPRRNYWPHFRKMAREFRLNLCDTPRAMTQGAEVAAMTVLCCPEQGHEETGAQELSVNGVRGRRLHGGIRRLSMYLVVRQPPGCGHRWNGVPYELNL